MLGLRAKVYLEQNHDTRPHTCSWTDVEPASKMEIVLMRNHLQSKQTRPCEDPVSIAPSSRVAAFPYRRSRRILRNALESAAATTRLLQRKAASYEAQESAVIQDSAADRCRPGARTCQAADTEGQQ